MDGQEKIWLDATLNSTSSKQYARYYQIIQQSDSSVYIMKYYRLNNTLLMKGDAIDDGGIKLHGFSQWYHENGLIESEGFYKNGAKVGIWKRYSNNGVSKSDKMYSSVNMENIIFNSALVMPKPGNQLSDFDAYLNQKLIQKQAFDIIALSPIKLQFIVFRDGSIKEIKVDEKLSQNQQQLLGKIIKDMPAWNAGSNGTQTINVRLDLNIDLGN